MTGENHHNYGQTLSDETKTKISDTAKKIDHSGRFKTGHKNSDETLQNFTGGMLKKVNQDPKELEDPLNK